MSLPASLIKAGYGPLESLRAKRLRRLLVGTEGLSDTGKTEFMLTAPGPGAVVVLDRGVDAIADNPKPPPTRRSDFGFKVISIPTATQGSTPAFYTDYWMAFLKEYLEILKNPDVRTVGIDGDSDSWELQRLAEFGKLANVWPQTKYGDVYAARRAMINRAWDAGKIVIATNKLKELWKPILDAQGNEILESNGEPKREPSGEWRSQGFPDTDYLWQIRLRHLTRLRETKAGRIREWGIKILKCKANMELMGEELWGEDCTFLGLVSLCYPQVDPKEWGL